MMENEIIGYCKSCGKDIPLEGCRVVYDSGKTVAVTTPDGAAHFVNVGMSIESQRAARIARENENRGVVDEFSIVDAPPFNPNLYPAQARYQRMMARARQNQIEEQLENNKEQDNDGNEVDA